ncbi:MULTISPECIES: alpha/beta hydrolase [Nocardiaceae]|jgi:diacylglycerol O-acyltransferase/trehalose O-mycolyltransferase|uniref:alpha/beta hydrolase n=1 Tax=Nocardiaceae TaxID=85025 RepID=UPI0003FA0D5A|nr:MULTISPECIES: alpha/beta hydrolase family protein [Rhodococcus]MDP9638358.1 S-formylglutathione hydrolase FrmB [Rhodococcus cercidiphylli]AMY53557.1 Diacylglycerol acyltransferase/mycolyltransferase Ag85A [Rhodococcus fascians D188]KJV01899.1 esterase [Rhodococcus sp. PML026]KMJ51781.1 mycolyltransferase [Rhodococcus fascians]MBY4010639.1 esterase family protein [Rhodococcus fascians]
MRRRRISTTVFVAALSLSIASGGIASAEPAAPSARIVDTVLTSDTLRTLKVDSPAMGAVVEVQVLTPAAKSGPRPTLYMLSGIGEEDPHNSMWLRKGQAAEFFADKNVNVVLPLAGPGSFYTDWQRDDPKLGRYQWETFLTEELPPLIDAAVDGNGRNAIAGLSMGAQSAMMLAARNPDVYSGVASYSGCFASAEPLGQASIRAIVGAFGGNADNMWGGPFDPAWAEHDSVANAESLRGTDVYVSVGTGAPGRHESFDTAAGWDRVVVGGLIEVGSNYCTHRLADRLGQLNIPATFDFTETGTHSWPYWVEQLPKSWPTLAGSLGISG